jgi:signal transduction histidine kinase
VRRRIVTLSVLAAVLAITLFGVPLGYAVAQSFIGDEVSEAEQIADVAAITVAADLARGRSVPDLHGSEKDVDLGLYSVDGVRLSGVGPRRADPVVRRAATRTEVATDDDDAGNLAVAVPVTDGTTVTGVVRAATPYTSAWLRIVGAWALMLGLGALAVAATWLVARRQARRLSAPLELLAGSAQRLGEGDFSVRTSRSGIAEIDAASSALDTTADRLGGLVDRERAFSSNASHQLRTPLTGLRLTLETALELPADARADAIASAIESADRLERTIDDLLALGRHSPAPRAELPVAQLVEGWTATWRPVLEARRRALRVNVTPDAPAGRASEAAVRQVVDVLLDNAVAHGAGTVTVVLRDAGQILAIDVGDEGNGPPEPATVFRRREGASTGHGTGHGIGLALARSLAEAEGGRLLLSRARPPVFSLLLPAESPVRS